MLFRVLAVDSGSRFPGYIYSHFYSGRYSDSCFPGLGYSCIEINSQSPQIFSQCLFYSILGTWPWAWLHNIRTGARHHDRLYTGVRGRGPDGQGTRELGSERVPGTVANRGHRAAPPAAQHHDLLARTRGFPQGQGPRNYWSENVPPSPKVVVQFPSSSLVSNAWQISLTFHCSLILSNE